MFKKKKESVYELSEKELVSKMNELRDVQSNLYELSNNSIYHDVKIAEYNFRNHLRNGEEKFIKGPDYVITYIADGRIEPTMDYCIKLKEYLEELMRLYEKRDAVDEAKRLFKNDEIRLKNELGIN